MFQKSVFWFRYFLLLLFICIGVFVGVLFQNYTGIRSISISEICSNNHSIYRDIYDGADYIELYNDSRLTCKLGTLYLSDDIEELKKICLTGYRIAPKGYNVVWLNQINDFSIDKTGD